MPSINGVLILKFAFAMPIISPHELPLAKAVAGIIGENSFTYLYAIASERERMALGWSLANTPSWCRPMSACVELVNSVDLLYSGIRDLDLFELRALACKPTIYASERWLKPILFPLGISLPGMLKLISKSYFCMVRRIVGLLSSNKLIYFPQGLWAAKDMARLCGLMHGDFRCLFRAPDLEFERVPGGKIWLKDGGDDNRYCLDKMRMWGYFVEPSKFGALTRNSQLTSHNTLRLLWVGRLLRLKRVDTIIKAVGELAKKRNVSLDIYGAGPEENRLKKLAAKYSDAIKFYPPVPIVEVRRLMREHDVYVLSSNAYEGWGAVVSEAMEEGLIVLCSTAAGAGATMLPKECLFGVGDWQMLMEKLWNLPHRVAISDWCVKYAADRLCRFARGVYDEKGS